MLVPLELCGGGELRALHHDLAERLQRDETLIELQGLRRVEAVESLVGEALLASDGGAGVTVRLRAGERVGFVALAGPTGAPSSRRPIRVTG